MLAWLLLALIDLCLAKHALIARRAETREGVQTIKTHSVVQARIARTIVNQCG